MGPPWSQLTAYDLNSGKILWQVPNGEMPGLPGGKTEPGSYAPRGGPVACTWDMNNCGPFEEIFSFHAGGANVLMGDGSCRFVNENLAVAPLRAIITRSGGEADADY